MGWNFGDIYDAIGAKLGDKQIALIHAGPGGGQGMSITWSAFTARTNRLARFLAAQGLEPDAKVAHYMRNCPAYVETMVACFKGRFVHVNVNYRYVEDELFYIFDNSDAEAVVYAREFREQVDRLRDRLPKVKTYIEIPAYFSEEDPVPDYATSYRQVTESGDADRLNIERQGTDLLFLYTGGTTGMPKGVMWEHEAIWNAGGAGASILRPGVEPPASPEEHATRVAAAPFWPNLLAACPLMHGTAMLSAINTLNQGGAVVTVPETSLDTAALWRTVERCKVNSMAIVGDAFAKPMLRELDENGDKYDISSLIGMISSGVMWSPEVKKGLLRHNENMALVDSFGASEAIGFGASRTTKDSDSSTAKFQIGEHCKVFTEKHREVSPGSGEAGFVARSRNIPVGYYKDEEKTAKTFPVIHGVRYSIPGDWCTVDADGTLTLLGRGSVCINSGGEKIFPEEIEEVLKLHESIDDALVVGVPDDRWGQAVTGVVVLASGAELDEQELKDFVKKYLAAYKAPKYIVATDVPLRAPNGKADYKRATQAAKETLGVN